MSSRPLHRAPGPFSVHQIRDGDPYELADGHPVECLPSGGRHARANVSGGLTLETDPEVDAAGFDAGFTPDERNLRAPDIAVGNVPDAPGWVSGAPPLAVEYADIGQDEAGLRDKVAALLAAGTRYVWVVRLAGPRRVEVHERDGGRFVATPGQELRAPGVLRNPVPVEALYDADAAHRVALRNLLQRQGYEDLEAVLRKGWERGLREGAQRGLREGHEKGLQEGQAAMAVRLARRLITGLGEGEAARIRELPTPRLEALVDVLPDLGDVEALRAWLAAGP